MAATHSSVQAKSSRFPSEKVPEAVSTHTLTQPHSHNHTHTTTHTTTHTLTHIHSNNHTQTLQQQKELFLTKNEHREVLIHIYFSN